MTNSVLHRLPVSAAALSIPAQAEPPEMKTTTPIPPGIATPDTPETSLGRLDLVDGIPTEETAQRVYDDLGPIRATEASLPSVRIASMEALRRDRAEFGPPNTTVLAFRELMDPKALRLMPDTTSVYFAVWLELGDEPMVIETTPNVPGLIDDRRSLHVTDFGGAGSDGGEGGRHPIVPPVHRGDVPTEGYRVVRTDTFGNRAAWRGLQVNGDPGPAAEETNESFRVYPPSEADDPPETTVLDMSGVPRGTIHRMDSHPFDEVDAAVRAEPPVGQSPELLGLLASIGISKGQPFEPDGRMQRILANAADIGAATARILAVRPRRGDFYWYPGEIYRTTPLVDGGYQFLQDGARLPDTHTLSHFHATGIAPTTSLGGVGSQYAALFFDRDGRPLDGSRTYTITPPPWVPAKNSAAIVLYDNQTRSQSRTDQRFPSVESSGGTMQANADGPTAVWAGPEAPEGKESNRTQTVRGKGWNAVLRLCGALEPWLGQIWWPEDAVVVQ